MATNRKQQKTIVVNSRLLMYRNTKICSLGFRTIVVFLIVVDLRLVWIQDFWSLHVVRIR